MNIKYTLSLAVAATLVSAPALQAATSSATRIASIAKLPNWNGIWRVTGNTQYLSGDKNNQPAFKADWPGKQKDNNELDTAEHYCAIAMPRLLSVNEPFEIIVTPEETLVFYATREIRHLWTDGRDQPPADENWPMYWAESKGQWQGQTLVMETINVHGDLWIDSTGTKLSDAARINERISQVDANHLKDEVTITDTTALSQPFTFTRTYERLPDTELKEQLCQWSAGQAAE